MKRDILLDALAKQKGCVESYDDVFEVMEALSDLNLMARTQGILSLEEAVSEMVATAEPPAKIADLSYYRLCGVERIVAVMLMAIINGRERDFVEEVGELCYFSCNLKGREALAGYLSVVGCLCIQDGLNPTAQKELFLAALSEEAAARYFEWVIENVEE